MDRCRWQSTPSLSRPSQSVSQPVAGGVVRRPRSKDRCEPTLGQARLRGSFRLRPSPGESHRNDPCSSARQCGSGAANQGGAPESRAAEGRRSAPLTPADPAPQLLAALLPAGPCPPKKKPRLGSFAHSQLSGGVGPSRRQGPLRASTALRFSLGLRPRWSTSSPPEPFRALSRGSHGGTGTRPATVFWYSPKVRRLGCRTRRSLRTPGTADRLLARPALRRPGHDIDEPLVARNDKQAAGRRSGIHRSGITGEADVRVEPHRLGRVTPGPVRVPDEDTSRRGERHVVRVQDHPICAGSARRRHAASSGS